MVLLADVFYRIAHAPYTGRPKLAPVALGVGVAAGLLAELLAAEQIRVTDGTIRSAGRRPPPADALAHTILDTVAAEQDLDHPLKVWLRFLGRDATAQVGQRLKRACEVAEQTAWRGLNRRTTLVPVNPQVFEGHTAHLYFSLAAGKIPTWDVAWVAGICLATGLHRSLLAGAPPQALPYLQLVASELPAGIRDLIDAAAAATAEAVMTHR